MKKALFLPVFAVAAFISLTGFMISNLDAASNKHKASWGEDFYFYAYAYGSGTSLSNAPADPEGYEIVYTDGSESVFKIEYTIATDGGVGLGVEAPGSGNTELEGCTGGFRYTYKGSHPHIFRAAVTGITADGGEEHFKNFEASATNWAIAEILLADLKQPNWANPKVTFATNIIEKFAWQVQTAGSGSLSIKDFECMESSSSVSSSSDSPSSSSDSPSSSSDSPSSSSDSPSSSSANLGTSSGSYSGEREVISDFEDGSTLSKLGENKYWYIYTDNEAGGASTVDNEEQEDGYKVIVEDEGSWYVKIMDYTLDKGTYEYEPFVVMAVDNEKDLSGCVGGFEYRYKGTSHNFKVELSTVEDDAHYFKTIAASEYWKKATVSLSDLKQPTDWGDEVAFDAIEITKFAWEVVGGISTRTGDLSIDDFTCLGTFSPPVSSSSEEVSSSSEEISSSSSSTETLSSSSSETTYAKLPHIVRSNAINPMHNGVNLQVMDNAAIQIFDLKGNAIRTLRFKPGSYVVQFAGLPRGLYVVKATSTSWKQTVKIAVK
jgi:predicted transcriptional regulator with HTH domain